MNVRHTKYLLVGAGLAGSSAAQAIRLRDPHGSIVLVGQEVNGPYHRPRLSHDYLVRKIVRADLTTLPLGWYGDNQVELTTGRRVARLDPARHSATLDNGVEIIYDRMLLAVGVLPRPLNVPGADLPNVYPLRTVDDADHLGHAIESARREGRPHDPADKSSPRGRVAVIGGGLLGVEMCAVFSQVGLKVDLLVAEAHPWSKFAGEHVGGHVTRHLQSNGVTVHNHARVARLEGDGRVQRVVTDDGQTIHCDFAVVAIGTVFNREILRGTHIHAEKHILVDQWCRTNVEDVYAAGDCAAVFDPLFGKHRAVEHWHSARLTGAIAGANMAGDDMPYDIVSHFSTRVFGLRASVWGEARHVAHRHTRRTESGEGMVEFGVAATGRISQVLAVGSGQIDDPAFPELVRRRLDVTGRVERLIDPATELSSLL